MKWTWLTPEELLPGAAADRLRSGAAPAHDAWRDADVLLVMPATDRLQAERAAVQLCARAGVTDAYLALVHDHQRLGFIEIANRCFRASRSRLFGYLAQDAFGGRRWLRLAVDALDADQKGLLGFNDGKWQGMLAAFGLGRRTWLEANYGGPLFHPDYTSHYADTELTLLAMAQKQYAHHAHAVLIELDWEKDGKGVNRLDKALFASRKTGWLAERIDNPALLNLFA